MFRGRGSPASGIEARIQISSSRAVSRRNVSDEPPRGCAMRSDSIEKPVQNISGKKRETRAAVLRAFEMAPRPPVVLGHVLPGEVHLDQG